ncbi:MAG: ABC transporter ATP-binding protein [Acidimicrobiia bacterium]|nr:ABC transporter ATP-binding protein [Acidimicrobiia bacterium]
MVLALEELTKEFSTGFLRRGRHRAVDGLSLDLARGEVFGLLGPNGAGKSTTLKLITGLLWPTSGRVSVFGRAPHDPQARAALGFLPEHPTFYDHLTGEELLAYLAGVCGLRGLDLTTRVQRTLDRVGLGDARTRAVRQYSKGMVQRLGLAQAIVNDPALVILDEPMSGLDPIGRREVRELILELRDAGRTVLFSSHILSDAEMLCSRVAILSRGRLVASGTTSDLTSGQTRGWEITAAQLTPAAVAALQPKTIKAVRITHGRYTFELSAEQRPEPVVAELAACGATLESVTPLRATLEDVFVERVS